MSGKIKLASQTLSTIDGHWDEKVMIKDKRNGVSTVLMCQADKSRFKYKAKF